MEGGCDRVKSASYDSPSLLRIPFRLRRYLDAVPVLFTFKFLGHVDEGFFANESFHFVSTKRSSGSRF